MYSNQDPIVIENPNPREKITDGELYVKHLLRNSSRFNGWTIYEQPVINSMHPDFIVTHPEKGILIIEVKDWHLNPPQYLPNAQVLWADRCYHTENPVDQVTAYKDLISKYELQSFLEANERYSKRSFAMITSIVYFHVANRQQALSFCGNPSPERCLVWTKSDLEELCLHNGRDARRFPECLFYNQSTFAKDTAQTMQSLVRDLDALLRPSNYALERQNVITLSPDQQTLIPIKKNATRRWSGVAGSGKTLILATKAAQALKQGKNVLLLTFNITLRHYIRDLCSQQFGDGDRKLLKSDLTIAHFHGFLKIVMTELNIQINHFDDIEHYTNEAIEKIQQKLKHEHPAYLKYDCIFIDEGQDFNGPWILFLKQFFTQNGETLIVYDQAQSIYENQGVWLTDKDQIKGLGFSGPPGYLKVSHRLPESIVEQIDRLSDLFNVEEKIQSASTQGDLFTKIQWSNISPIERRTDIVANKIAEILSDGTSTIEDITIITMRENAGLEIIQTTNPRYGISHVYDLSGDQDYYARRTQKWRFQPGIGKLKVCSYHSFKGWESSHIILLLDGIGDSNLMFEEMRKAMFISLTRVNSFSDARSFTCLNSCAEFEHLSRFF